MRVQHMGYRIRGFYKVAALGHLWDMTPKDAERRLEILRYFEKYGLAPTTDAFHVSRRTLERRRPRSRPRVATPPPWRQNPLPPRGEEPPRPILAW